MPIFLKRAYDDVADNDGLRILIDRLWPRGVSKASLKLDYWFKTIAPSSTLRKWFNHDPSKFVEFKQAYLQELTELEQNRDHQLRELKKLVSEYDTVTLIYGAKDRQHNHAIVLKESLEIL